MTKISGKLGLIGCGNMGSAILRGVLENSLTTSSRVFVSDALPKKATTLSRQLRVKRAKSNEALFESAQIILLAIKPQDLKNLSAEISPSALKGKIIISILAGTPTAKLKKAFGTKTIIVRAMPNLGAQVGESVTAITSTNQKALKIAEQIFSGCGSVVRAHEKHFDLITAISGSGPAYFFLMMELLAEAAVKKGISRQAAELLAVQTALGAGQLARISAISPGKLRAMVTSKKGTTDAALKQLKKKGFSKIFESGLRSAVKRAEELSRI